jgi:retron-type reverse transcriptase
MQLSLFDTNSNQEQLRKIDVEQLFEAYLSCRKTKRYTQNALKFEVDYEANLFQLKDEIENGSYSPGRSIAFIVNKPVKREIFAADFRDRVVHHWLINKLNPLFEKVFIKDSYACRIGKGTHYGVKRADSFIKACSENYTKDSYILKLDILGFFMHINRKLLYTMLEKFIHQYYTQQDKAFVLEITKKSFLINLPKIAL